jgi:restriction endonuclease Mrr
MGYGGKEALLTHTGKPGGAGLDGIIRQDALGLDLVGVQAKRYDRESAVQRPEMQRLSAHCRGRRRVEESSSRLADLAAGRDCSLTRWRCG